MNPYRDCHHHQYPSLLLLWDGLFPNEAIRVLDLILLGLPTLFPSRCWEENVPVDRTVSAFPCLTSLPIPALLHAHPHLPPRRCPPPLHLLN